MCLYVHQRIHLLPTLPYKSGKESRDSLAYTQAKDKFCKQIFMVCKRPSSTSLTCYQLCIKSTGTTFHLGTKSSKERRDLVDVHVPYRNDSFKAPGRCSACAPGKGVLFFSPEIPEIMLGWRSVRISPCYTGMRRDRHCAVRTLTPS